MDEPVLVPLSSLSEGDVFALIGPEPDHPYLTVGDPYLLVMDVSVGGQRVVIHQITRTAYVIRVPDAALVDYRGSAV